MHKNLSANPTLHCDKILNEVKCNVSDFKFALQLFQNPHTLSDFLLLVQLISLVPELVLHIWLLLVHSNSNLHERKFLFFFGSIRTQPAPDPSNALDP